MANTVNKALTSSHVRSLQGTTQRSWRRRKVRLVRGPGDLEVVRVEIGDIGKRAGSCG